jgi:uncharacterized phage infection (PIP) family protein YhgE
MPAKKKTTTTKKKAAPARRIRRRPVFSFGAIDPTYDPSILNDPNADMQQIVLRINGTFNVGSSQVKGQYKQLLTTLRNNNPDRFKAFVQTLMRLGGRANNDLLDFIQNMPSQEQAAVAAATARRAETMGKLAEIRPPPTQTGPSLTAAVQGPKTSILQTRPAAEAPASLPSQQPSLPAPSGNGGSGKGLALINSVQDLSKGVTQAVSVLSKLGTVEQQLKDQISNLKKELAIAGRQYSVLEQQHAGITEKLAQAQQDHEKALAAAKQAGESATAAAQQQAQQTLAAAAAREEALKTKQQELEARATEVTAQGQQTAADLTQKTAQLSQLEGEVEKVTTQLKELTTQLETALAKVPENMKTMEAEAYVTQIMEQAASEVQQQFGISHRFKFGSCGKKMHGKKRTSSYKKQRK